MVFAVFLLFLTQSQAITPQPALTQVTIWHCLMVGSMAIHRSIGLFACLPGLGLAYGFSQQLPNFTGPCPCQCTHHHHFPWAGRGFVPRIRHQLVKDCGYRILYAEMGSGGGGRTTSHLSPFGLLVHLHKGPQTF